MNFHSDCPGESTYAADVWSVIFERRGLAGGDGGRSEGEEESSRLGYDCLKQSEDANGEDEGRVHFADKV